jgi:hypothetical protein
MELAARGVFVHFVHQVHSGHRSCHSAEGTKVLCRKRRETGIAYGIIGIGKASKPLQFQRSCLIIFSHDSSILESKPILILAGVASSPRVFSQ